MNKKNWLLLFFACAITFTSFNSCSKDDDDGTSTDDGPTEWTKSTVFTGDPRSGAASFTIDGKGAYVVGGYVNPTVGIAQDGRVFNGNGWSEITEFTGSARHEAVGFAVGGKGYIGTGRNLDNELFKDFYQYDPAQDSWTKIADFPGVARSGAIAFALGNYAYVGLGTNAGGGRLGDVYRYDPSQNEWSAVDNLPFKDKLSGAFAFVIGDKAYIGGGYSGSSNLPDGFYTFDGTNWTTSSTGLNRSDDSYTYDARKYNAATFVIGNFAYVVSGRNANSITSTVWKYDPSSESWTDKHQALSTDPREKGIGFSLNGKGYVVTGVNGSLVFDNMYEFTPVR